MATLLWILVSVLLLQEGLGHLHQPDSEPSADDQGSISARRGLVVESTSAPTVSPTTSLSPTTSHSPSTSRQPTGQPTDAPTGVPTTRAPTKAPAQPPCVQVSSWSALAAAIQSAALPRVFCPFVIVKPASAAAITIRAAKVLTCKSPRACVVEGPGTHLVLTGQAQLAMKGFVFRKATTSSVVITSRRGQLFELCTWAFNVRTSTSTTDVGGGSILMQPGSSVTLTGCRFNSNRARVGGAIRHGGNRLVVSGTTFAANRAAAGGGAIAIVGSSTLTPELHLQDSNTFTANKDDKKNLKSGAIHSTTTNGIIIKASTTGSTNDGCNGLYVSLRNLCIPFAHVPYKFGRLVMRDHGILFSQGLVMEIVAMSGAPVRFTSPSATSASSTINFHDNPDGAAIVPLNATDGGGFVYVSNSESLKNVGGGAYALYFDDAGRPRGYKQLLGGTSWNCNGGLTPWNTWVSCEEYPGGHCYQTDPTGKRPAAKTKLGGSTGGQFEAVAVNNDDPANPVFFLTEDKSDGAVRRWRPSSGSTIGWDMLHGNGVLDYLEFLPNNQFQWTTSLDAARTSAYNFYRNVEGIVYRNRRLVFASKAQFQFFILDLDAKTWTRRSSVAGNTTGGGGIMNGQADQLSLHGDGVLYVAEDGGTWPGVFVEQRSQFYAFLQMYDSKYSGEDVTGVNFSPDGRMMFVCAQRQGLLFRVRRIDGEVLEGAEAVSLRRALRL
jgi:uncharacterized protein